MISINTFSLMDNFQRVLWEFHDDKLTLKIKSLNLEIENEIKYEKIKEIRSTKAVDLRWLWIVVLSAMLISTPKLFVESSSTVILIEKVIFVFLLALIIQAFRKYEYCSFLDADGKYLASIRVSKKEQKTLLKGAINLIKRNTEIINESILEEPLPNTPPVFEIVEFDFPNYLNKSRVRFYENEIIEVDKGLCREEVSKTKYREFSGRTQIVKTGNNNWDSFFCFWLYFVAIVNTTAFVFFSRQIAEIFVRGNSHLSISLERFPIVNSNFFFEIYKK